MTTLDPHDFIQPGLDVPIGTVTDLAGAAIGAAAGSWFFGVGALAGARTGVEVAELLRAVLGVPDVLYYGDFHDPDVQRWNNVGFLDNYYQTVADPNSHFTFTPNGRAIAGADINRQLDGRSGFTVDDRIAGTHGRPISWYMGTVDLSAYAIYDSKAVRDLPHDAKDKDDLIYRALYNRDYTNDMPAILPDLKYNDTPWYLAD